MITIFLLLITQLLEKLKIKKKIITPNSFNFDTFIKNTSIATSSMLIKRDKIKKLNYQNLQTLRTII